MHAFLARPKVNLYLEISGRLSNGYHLLNSLAVFPKTGDLLTVNAANTLELEIEGTAPSGLGSADQNLVYRAAQLLQSKTGTRQGALITLQKNLPIASGVGGGSSDAAGALHLLNQLWALDISIDQLAVWSAELGADLPVCVHGSAAFMSGIGDIIHPAPSFPDFHMLLVNPGMEVSTPAIFKQLDLPRKDQDPLVEIPDLQNLNFDQFIQYLKKRCNDLTPPAMAQVPDIKQVLSEIAQTSGCALSRMSGSGATCFGIYETPEQARAAEVRIATDHPSWWIIPAPVSG
jgi:4-diphosphocytidyl-2-C-methyl-D-erythritol kinase